MSELEHTSRPLQSISMRHALLAGMSAQCGCPLCRAVRDNSLRLLGRELFQPPHPPGSELLQLQLPNTTEAVRCEATVLFADLSGYSALTEARDVDFVAEMLERFKVEAARIVAAYGGFVNQFVGDEVLAIFGFPHGKQDGPRCAIDAALQLHALVRSAAFEPRAGVGGGSLRLHSGIDAGVVLMKRRDVRGGLFELTGAAVKRAAQLRARAAADEVVVSGRVYARVAGSFAGRELPAHAFKGAVASSLPYRIESRRAHSQSPIPRTVRSAARREIAELQRFVEEREHRGEGGLAALLGPAGSGKSRLLDRLSGELSHEGFRGIALRGSQAASLPFSALRGLLDRCALGLPRERVDAYGGEASGPPAGPSAQPEPSFVPAHAVLDTQSQWQFVSDAVDAVCAHFEQSQTTHVLFVDDAQWLDASSRLFLTHLVPQLCGGGHLVILAGRDEPQVRATLEQLCSRVPTSTTVTVELGALTPEDATEIVADCLGITAASALPLAEQLRTLSDGTPLGLCELVEQLVQGRQLRRDADIWQLGSQRLLETGSPPSARALFEQRIASLPAETQRVLRFAAITRSRIDAGLLADVTELSLDAVQTALDDAFVGHMLELDADGSPQFTHDIVWEALLCGVPSEQQRAMHQEVASAMQARPDGSEAYVFALAHHYAAGLVDEDFSGAFRALADAAQLALRSCDDILALSLLRTAELAARRGLLDPGAAFYAQLGEVSLRTGALSHASSYFEAAILRSTTGVERAHLLGRAAWIQHYQGATASPVELLDEALRECGADLPGSRIPRDALQLVTRRSGRGVSSSTPSQRRRLEVVCGLYREYFRVCVERDQPLRGYAAALKLANVAVELPACRVRAQSDALIALAVSELGARALVRKHMQRAFTTAQLIDDPVATAYCHQIAHIEAAWRGDLVAGEAHARACVDDRGQYMELAELCMVCMGMYLFELYRGRHRDALAWTQRAIDRVLHRGLAPAVFLLIEEAACTTLAAVDQADAACALRERLRSLERQQLGRGAVAYQVLDVCKLHALVERQALGAELDALVDKVGAAAARPEHAQPCMTAWFALVGHARVQQCFRATRAELPMAVAKLKRALDDVEACARLPLRAVHARALRGAYAYFSGRPREAERCLARAERNAQDLGMISVMLASARIRAHILRDAGEHVGSLEQARVAERLAERHGQLAQLQAIRAELDLAAHPAEPATGPRTA